MSELIDELKREHAQIVFALKEVKQMGFTSKDAEDKILSIKTGLFEHLKREDQELYPVLKKAAENDENLKQILDSFAKDMTDVSKTAVQFFEKQTEGGTETEFARDLKNLIMELASRIKREEMTLFTEYEIYSKLLN